MQLGGDVTQIEKIRQCKYVPRPNQFARGEKPVE
jgi:hypothetical protein